MVTKLYKILSIFKHSKYLLISTMLHFVIALIFIIPYFSFFFKKEVIFLSLNKPSSIKLIVTKPKSNQKLLKKTKGIIKNNKNNKNLKKITSKRLEQKESIVASQYISNIKYNVLATKEPNYPTEVKKFRLSQQVIIKTRLLVNKQGNIEKVEFLKSNIDKSLESFFQKEILESLNYWKFSKITLNNKPVSIYFYKDFIFIN